VILERWELQALALLELLDLWAAREPQGLERLGLLEPRVLWEARGLQALWEVQEPLAAQVLRVLLVALDLLEPQDQQAHKEVQA
jgi:hypothetical protein